MFQSGKSNNEDKEMAIERENEKKNLKFRTQLRRQEPDGWWTLPRLILVSVLIMALLYTVGAWSVVGWVGTKLWALHIYSIAKTVLLRPIS